MTAGYNTLKNSADSSKTIAYTLKSGGSSFTSVDFDTQGESAALTVDIAQAAWHAAYAGSYSDTITFTVSYVNVST